MFEMPSLSRLPRGPRTCESGRAHGGSGVGGDRMGDGRALRPGQRPSVHPRVHRTAPFSSETRATDARLYSDLLISY